MTRHLVDVTMLWGKRSGGVARYLRTKRRWLDAHTVWLHTIAVPSARGHSEQPISTWPAVQFNGYRFPLGRAAGARTLKALAPDIIEVGDPYRLAWSALDAGQALGIPVVMFCHSNVVAMARRHGGEVGASYATRYLRHLCRGFDAVLAPSQWMGNVLRDAGIDRVARQPLGVDAERYHPKRRDVGWKLQLGLARSDRVVLYAGRFAAEKNLQVLAQAVDQLGPPYALVAIGAGLYAPRGRRVKVLPYESSELQLARALASADVFAHAGEGETFGLGILEAMACGTPVVARPCAGVAELLAPGASVAVCNNTPAAFAEAIAGAAATADDDDDSGRRAARQQALRFPWHSALRAMTYRYEQLIGSHPAAPRPDCRRQPMVAEHA